MPESLSEYYIKRAIGLAKKGAGNVSPNPMVGAVLVKNGKIIGEGYHQKFGEAHAEVNAIKSATESVAGSTLYCNLEPCCHLNKKTPPCAQRIIKEGIKKVVICNLDPNPEVSGNGIQLFKEAGIEVEVGILEKEGKELNRFFFKHIITGLPYVTVKIAQTLDGKISEEKGKQSWITGEESVKQVHKWRSEYDAVLVGAGTVMIDDPELTVRHVKGCDPYRIIIDGELKVSLASKIFNVKDSEKTIIVTSQFADKNKVKELNENGIRFINLHTSTKKINIKDIIIEIGKLGISSVLVEGGGQIFSQFISEEMFDELKIFISPKIFGSGIPGLSLPMNNDYKLKLSKYQKSGNDILLTYFPS